ncbi:MAG: DedA family protein [Candidatus Kapabacteria bacterium]|nr:DedA family protein [Candidatus Kapabacteria bacterium]
MELLQSFIDIFLHLDRYLVQWTLEYGIWLYALLFLIIFAETGLVVAPFLPGDSLLFATGAVCALQDSALNVWIMIPLLIVAAVVGDAVNYTIGQKIGLRLFRNPKARFLNQKNLDATHAFYEKHGGKAVIIARFAPFVRTFVPFVAGVGSMTYKKFFSYNVIGGVLWIASFTILGFLFGNVPIVKKNFTLVIFGIIFLSILPGIIEFLKHKFATKKA